MITKITLTQILSKNAYESIRQRLNPATAAKSTKQSLLFLYNHGPITEINLRETDLSKPTRTYIMNTTIDVVEELPAAELYAWLMELYQEKFQVSDITDFPEYSQLICDYAIYQQTLPVEDADKTINKLLKTEKWLPVQLNQSLWDNHQLKNGYAWHGAAKGKDSFILRFSCNASYLKKKCRDPQHIRTHGVTLAFALNPRTEEIFMHWGKTEVYKTNRINRSPYKPEGMLDILPESDKAIAAKLIVAAQKNGLKPDITYKPEQMNWKCVYFLKKPKTKIFTLWASPEQFSVKANLFKIDNYLAESDITQTLKSQFLDNTMECANCEAYQCSGAKITLDGHTYRRCIYGAYAFHNMEAQDYDALIGLMEKEIAEAERGE